MEQLKKILLWGISAFLLILGISMLSIIALPAACIFFFLAVFSNPLLHKLLKKKNITIKKYIYIPVFLSLFLVACAISPSSESSSDTASQANTLEESSTQVESSVATKEETSDKVTKDTTAEQTSKSKATSTKKEESSGASSEETKAKSGSTKTNSVSEMKIHFIDVGQADAILIQSAGENMLIDAGNVEDGSAVTTYLKENSVESLKYVIGTHPHEDHIGGLASVISYYKITTFIMPDKVHSSQCFESVLDTLESKNLSITKPVVGTEYTLGDATFTILSPVASDYGDDLNDYSVGIKITNGENSFVMCGDAQTNAEVDICSTGIDLSADVLKLGHHGSDTATSSEFLTAVNPTYAIISCGADNSYGHPYKETLEKVSSYPCSIFRTDKQGTIIATSDGKNITFNTTPCTDLTPGSNSQSSQESDSTYSNTASDATSTTQNTIANDDKSQVEVHITESGGKYHNAGCRYLSKSDITTTLSDALARGLEPCSKCNPPQ